MVLVIIRETLRVFIWGIRFLALFSIVTYTITPFNNLYRMMFRLDPDDFKSFIILLIKLISLSILLVLLAQPSTVISAFTELKYLVLKLI